MKVINIFYKFIINFKHKNCCIYTFLVFIEAKLTFCKTFWRAMLGCSHGGIKIKESYRAEVLKAVKIQKKRHSVPFSDPIENYFRFLTFHRKQTRSGERNFPSLHLY